MSGVNSVNNVAGESVPDTPSQRRQQEIVRQTVRWYSLVTSTLAAFVIGIRMCFPIQSDAEAYNNTVRWVAQDIASIALVHYITNRLTYNFCYFCMPLQI